MTKPKPRPSKSRRPGSHDALVHALHTNDAAGVEAALAAGPTYRPVEGDSSAIVVERVRTAPHPDAPAILVWLETASLRESENNPRKTFDPVALEQLQDSIVRSGMVTPILARPITTEDGGRYEIAAGHRRFRVARALGLETVPVIVRAMTDQEFIEVLTIENLQRDNLPPLEEAYGFELLLKSGGYDIPAAAARIGRSTTYVYDRLRLLKLTKDLKALLASGQLGLGHAVILSRLTPTQQKGAADPHTGGLWQGENSHLRLQLGGAGPLSGLCLRTPAELQTWVDDRVRFDLASKDLPDLFPETARSVQVRSEDGKAGKPIAITYSHFVQEGARDAKERTWGPMSWRRADGLEESKLCGYAQPAVVVAGPGRGDFLLVCTQKKKCRVHWEKEIREAKAAATRRENGTSVVGDRQREPKPSFDWEARRRLGPAAAQKQRATVLAGILAAAKEVYGWDLPAMVVWNLARGLSLPNGWAPIGKQINVRPDFDIKVHLSQCTVVDAFADYGAQVKGATRFDDYRDVAGATVCLGAEVYFARDAGPVFAAIESDMKATWKAEQANAAAAAKAKAKGTKPAKKGKATA